MVRSRKPDQNLTKNIYKENFDCFTIGIIHLRPRFIKKKSLFFFLTARKIIILPAILDCYFLPGLHGCKDTRKI